MTEEIQKAINDLHEVLKAELGSNVTCARIFISNSEIGFEAETRSPAQLKSAGISMKNIMGDWIK